MFKSISLTIIATFIGQAFGFFADIFIASSFGTSWRADAYFLAMVIPIILADLFMLCINAVFIPSYMTYRNDGRESEFFNTVTSISLVIMTGIAAAAFFLSPSIIGHIAGKFTPEARGLTITLTRMLLVLAITMPLATILSSRLNAHDQFALPALGKTFNFGFIILSLLLFKGTIGIFSLPLGFISGNVVFILALVFLFYRSGLGYSPRINTRHPAIKEIAVLILPIVAATMVNYANIFVERSIAAGFSEGSISALNYAFKVVNMPLNLFILAGMTVLMPVFSRHAAKGDLEGLREITLKGLKFVSFFILPVIAMLVVLRVPLIRLLYERGAFSAESSATTSLAVLFYVFGLFGLAAVSLMSRVFYAIKEMKIMALLGAFVIVLNIILVFFLSRAFGFIGIPLTFTITSTVHMVVMLFILDSKLESPSTVAFFKSASAHLGATAVMGVICFISYNWLSTQFDMHSKLFIFLALVFSGTFGLATYMLISLISGIKEARLILERFLAGSMY